MAATKFFFSLQLWGATSSIPVMKMLADQAEGNIARVVSDAFISETSSSGTFEEDNFSQHGVFLGSHKRTWYSYGSCVGYDQDEVASQYRHLIAQLTRRSAFLTMFSIFEYNIIECLKLMTELTNTEYFSRPSLERCHTLLTSHIGGGSIKNVDHLIVIRNIMAHNNGVAENYKELLNCRKKTSDSQKRLVRELLRILESDCGITITNLNELNMDSRFLDYVISEFHRYTFELRTAVYAYWENSKSMGNTRTDRTH